MAAKATTAAPVSVAFAEPAVPEDPVVALAKRKQAPARGSLTSGPGRPSGQVPAQPATIRRQLDPSAPALPPP